MSKTPPPVGPGATGLYAGMAWGKIRAAQDDAAGAVAELQATRDRLLRTMATAEGYRATIGAMVDELRAEEAGTLKVRRLSDPSNRPARVQLSEDVESEELKRLSGGRLRAARTTPPSTRKPKP